MTSPSIVATNTSSINPSPANTTERILTTIKSYSPKDNSTLFSMTTNGIDTTLHPSNGFSTETTSQTMEALISQSTNDINMSDLNTNNPSFHRTQMMDEVSYNQQTGPYFSSSEDVSYIYKSFNNRTGVPITELFQNSEEPLLNISAISDTLAGTQESLDNSNAFTTKAPTSWVIERLSIITEANSKFPIIDRNTTLSYVDNANPATDATFLETSIKTTADTVNLSPTHLLTSSTNSTITSITMANQILEPSNNTNYNMTFMRFSTQDLPTGINYATLNDSLEDIYSQDDVREIVYNILIPIFIFIGFISNLLCIVILLRPRLRLVQVNQYFLVLAISDLLVCTFYIPIAITTNGCDISTYRAAIYFGYFGWSFIEIWQTLSFYIILCLSYDRFLAVWYWQWFKRQNANKLFKYRIAIIVITNILVHILFFINVKIWCMDGGPSNTCKPERLIIEDTYRRNDHESWHQIYLIFHELAVRWLPGLLLFIFNTGLIVAIFMGRLSHLAPSKSKRRMEFRLTVTLIAITCSFIIFTFPNTIYSVRFAENLMDKCYGKHEVFRAVSNNFQLTEHAVHIIFMVLLNPTFRVELFNFLTCKQSLDAQSDRYLSSRELQDHQVNKRSSNTPFPSKSPSHSPHPGKRLSTTSNSALTVNNSVLVVNNSGLMLTPPKPLM